MFRTCPHCQLPYNDTHRSTLCPHVGLGYCEICDCVVCVCDPAEKARRRAARMPPATAASPSLLHDFIPCDDPACADKPEHCIESWCGAPRMHSNHTCAQPGQQAGVEGKQ